MSKAREALEERVQKAIWQESFVRWESAVVLALTAMLTTFSAVGVPIVEFVPFWGWLLGGALAEAGLVYSSVLDPEFGRRVVTKMLKNEFKPERLNDKKLQQQINEALDYRSRIEKGIRERTDTMLKDELAQTASQIDDWLENIYDLAQRIDRYQQEREILHRDRVRAESRMKQLQAEFDRAQNPEIKEQVQTTLASIEQQLQILQTLEATIQRARLQLENSLAHLGTIYSQTMLVDAKDIDRGSARRLRHEIAEEVTELNDLLVSMDEVYTAESSG
ncbi:MAG: hypothetical protein KC433_05550 [Anaerolineales bacterium]|nr:hypothetical protein [Anaerolineales bacterium]MCB8939460.1 hypothetical protein [Ardenticatenaceae bacterium]